MKTVISILSALIAALVVAAQILYWLGSEHPQLVVFAALGGGLAGVLCWMLMRPRRSGGGINGLQAIGGMILLAALLVALNAPSTNGLLVAGFGSVVGTLFLLIPTLRPRG